MSSFHDDSSVCCVWSGIIVCRNVALILLVFPVLHRDVERKVRSDYLLTTSRSFKQRDTKIPSLFPTPSFAHLIVYLRSEHTPFRIFAFGVECASLAFVRYLDRDGHLLRRYAKWSTSGEDWRLHSQQNVKSQKLSPQNKMAEASLHTKNTLSSETLFSTMYVDFECGLRPH